MFKFLFTFTFFYFFLFIILFSKEYSKMSSTFKRIARRETLSASESDSDSQLEMVTKQKPKILRIDFSNKNYVGFMGLI